MPYTLEASLESPSTQTRLAWHPRATGHRPLGDFDSRVTRSLLHLTPSLGFPRLQVPVLHRELATWPLGQGQLSAVTRRDLSAPAGQAAPQRCSGTSTWPCPRATLRAAHAQPAVRVFSPAWSLCQRAADTAKLCEKEASASAHSASSHSTCRHAGSLGGSHQPAPSCASCTPLSKSEDSPGLTPRNQQRALPVPLRRACATAARGPPTRLLPAYSQRPSVNSELHCAPRASEYISTSGINVP